MIDHWLLLGASGVTGQAIAREAIRQGMHPVLGGRSADRLRPLAEELGLEVLIIDPDNADLLRSALRDMQAVVLATGAYESITPRIVEACLATETAYIDIANEIQVWRYLQSQDVRARSANIPLLFGCGFGVVVASCLGQFLVDNMPNPQELVVATHVATNQKGSIGATLSGLSIIQGGGRVVRRGRLVPFRLGRGTRMIPFSDTARLATPAPFGDLVALMETHVPDITFLSTALPTGIMGFALPAVRRMVRFPIIKRQFIPKNYPEASTREPVTTLARSQAWAWARDASGSIREAVLELGDGYEVAASAVIHVLQSLRTRSLAGALTPSQAFSADFVLRLPEAQRTWRRLG